MKRQVIRKPAKILHKTKLRWVKKKEFKRSSLFEFSRLDLGPKKVFVGLSGGVDSSVSAALLKKAGYDVTGVFIKVWQPDFWNSPSTSSGQSQFHCDWKEDMRDAMRVCAKLDIPFIKLDLEKEYKREVVDYMIREYRAGRTPNPDIMCNKYVKFGAFFDWAMKQGADYVATGHYAQIVKRKAQNVKLKKSGSRNVMGYMLHVSKDKEKDQTYFLYNLEQPHLAKTLFPIGHLEKSEVRKLAHRFGLVTAEKKDSQGLCFIGKVDMKDFLKHFIKEKHGRVLDTNGKVIGSHRGAVFYTIGERHGFFTRQNFVKQNLGGQAIKNRDQKPLYVISKDLKRNTITVDEKSQSHSGVRNSDRVFLSDVNWITGRQPLPLKTYKARIRYRQPLHECVVSVRNGQVQVKFKEKLEAVTFGQSLVLYDRNECLGGGIIY